MAAIWQAAAPPFSLRNHIIYAAEAGTNRGSRMVMMMVVVLVVVAVIMVVGVVMMRMIMIPLAHLVLVKFFS